MDFGIDSYISSENLCICIFRKNLIPSLIINSTYNESMFYYGISGQDEELEKLSSSCTSKMDFLSHVKDKYELSITDAKTVADKFFKKEV